MSIHTVFFDVGETLVDETRLWGAWADWIGVPRFTLFGVLGGLIERGEHHRRVFETLRPGMDVDRELAAMRAAGRPIGIARGDFYPDALPCLGLLRASGYRIGLAGNQPVEAEAELRALDLPVDFVASSAGWGVQKPSPAFFERVASLAGAPPEAIAYVGDRVDNDVVPASAAGMLAVFLRRGPWGYLHADSVEVARGYIRIDTLAELAAALKPSE